MDDLLKEAIADAKAVRETALENAKVALEEAFTPRLKSMLSKKIQSEIEEEGTEDEVTEDAVSDEDADSVDESDESDEIEEVEVQDEGMYEDEEEAPEAGEEEEAPEAEEGLEVDESEIIEIDGVKYAPVVSEDDEEEAEEEAPEDEEEFEDEDEGEDLDLEAVLRELESELEEDEDADFNEESDFVDEADDDEKEDVDEEVDKSSGIGKSDNHKGESDESSKIGVPGKAKHESVEETEEVIAESDESPVSESEEEEIDLEEVLRALQEEDEVDTTSEDMENLQTELDEHRDVVKYLRSKLNEVNLLNAKLLFTNKLFRSYGLSNDQKMKVVETFDRAKNLREVKLVYATMAESFVNGSTREEIVKESKKGSASKPVASTKSEKQEQEILSESDVMKQRFQKLANIL